MTNLIRKCFDNWMTITIIAGCIKMTIIRMAPEKKARLFALILTQHRVWGTILMPYIIVNEINKRYYNISECLSPFPDPTSLSNLSAEERDVVRIINGYSDRNLFKLFSKDRSVKEFIEKIAPDKYERIIRPFIEGKIYKCLSIARDEAIPVYFQKSRVNTLHSEDQLVIDGEIAVPVFIFNRTEEQTTYSLSLEAGGTIINLRKSAIDILCMSPCVIKKNSRIIFISEVDGPKLKPFFTKESILIPKNTELKYFKSFVLNAVNNFKVEGSGFEIIETVPEKKAVLDLEIGIRGIPVLILKYQYPGKGIFPNDLASSFTSFENTDGKFVFRKYLRDFEWEKKCRDILGELGFYADDEVNFSLASSGSNRMEEIYNTIEAINRSYNDLNESGFTLLTGKLDQNYNLKPVNIEISHKIIDDWFDLRAIVKIGEWKIPFIQLKRNILGGIREYLLPDGTVAILPESWFSKYRNIFEFGRSSDDSLMIHKQHFSLLSDALDDKDCDGCGRLEKLLIPDQIPELQSPEGLNCLMRQYQIEGLSWMHYLQSAGLGGCLADDMGLGKTIQTLALLQYNRENQKSGESIIAPEARTLFDSLPGRLTSLIVVPASLIYNWENEITRFTPEMRVYSYTGNQRKKSSSYFHLFDIILSTYHTVRQDIDIITTFSFHYVVLDESQVIKNPASLIYKTVVRLKSDYRLVLTGTPVENSLTDLWTQLNFVNPGLLGNLSFFRREYAKPIEKKKDDDKESRLRKIIKPFILRRTKGMVASDLPPVTEQTVFCDMTEEQAKIYGEEKSAVRNVILKNIEATGIEKSAIIVLQGLMKLRQISNHPVLAFEDYISGSGKFDRVLQDMESVVSEGHKVLVFSSFVKHLELYAEEFRKKRTRYSMLTGASINREKIVNSFQNEPSNRIFLISLKAGGVGLNLTAADYVYILDPWWNPASEMQALNRAHRIGQDKSVFVYRYISSDSIEEKIVRLQERKSRLADTFIQSSNPLKDIDLKEILDIIE
jgi:superfamily II DNA or RNA helicase